MIRGFDDLALSYVCNKYMWLWQEFRNWFGPVWFGSSWDNIHLKLLWKFYQDLTSFGCFREDLVLVWYGMVWFGMVWFGLVCYG